LNFKQSIDPLREAINTLYRQSSADNQKYFRDVYDHIVFESENISMYRELIVNLLELHQNMLSVKTNAVMKVLTIITTIFVPLTFIVGVYGMNFDNMPELRWQNGYYYVLGLMGLCVVGMLIFFKRQRWI
jgi:magnesium transporter